MIRFQQEVVTKPHPLVGLPITVVYVRREGSGPKAWSFACCHIEPGQALYEAKSWTASRGGRLKA